MQTQVRENTDRSRYELLIEDEVAAFLNYRTEGQQVSFDHTEVSTERRGQGLGSELVREALDAAQQQGLSVIPRCPFVADYIKRHEGYARLVPTGRRREFDVA